jgi:Amt family ammonium transporter
MAGCLVFGPCPGKSLERRPRIPLARIFQWAPLGLLILLGPQLAFNLDGGEPGGAIAINTFVADVTAASVVALCCWFCRREFDPARIGCGALSGFAAICGSCAFVNTSAAAAIGGVAGIVFMASASFLKRRGVDDVIHAASAFGAGGLWGMIAVGLFADGKNEPGWNGVVREKYVAQSGIDGVRGLFYGDASQLAAQLLAVGVLLVVGFGLSFLMFQLTNRILPAQHSPQTNR